MLMAAIKTSLRAALLEIEFRNACSRLADCSQSGENSVPWQSPRSLTNVWWDIFGVCRADQIIIRHHDNGFFANFLAVLDTLVLARNDAYVYVDWRLTGAESHFRYGPVGRNVWTEMFEPLSPTGELIHASPCCVVGGRMNRFLISRGKDLLSMHPNLAAIRSQYYRKYSSRIRIRNSYIKEEVERIRSAMRGHVAVGVHKRMSRREVAANQLSGRIPTDSMMIDTVEVIAARHKGICPLIYLATDDDDTLEAFRRHFGSRVMFRAGVQRFPPTSRTEVHTQPWERLGVKDACDVMIDALLLAECNQIVHMSSNVSTCVGFLNPKVELIHWELVEWPRRSW